MFSESLLNICITKSYLTSILNLNRLATDFSWHLLDFQPTSSKIPNFQNRCCSKNHETVNRDHRCKKHFLLLVYFFGFRSSSLKYVNFSSRLSREILKLCVSFCSFLIFFRYLVSEGGANDADGYSLKREKLKPMKSIVVIRFFYMVNAYYLQYLQPFFWSGFTFLL